ncbi:substrate-binding domain-containing protein [Methylomagnum ishizawai]|uniref:substrate-binding domain-containing protein n=1 Tax=Methylomagnum ishizawai TaxID=1760988 RepID=UPI001C32BAD4|nr:substrate-binding domain-containing protein [Methylomagnum ishizawai]BBL76931.1 phosphate ABC transporter substrate-binding protein [Methylomagnum ishizawai]
MRKHILARAALVSTALLGASASAEFQRGYIYTVGSTTLFPFAKTVGEHFSKAHKKQLPLLQSTGTGGGIKLFCEGAQGETPDIVNASRAMKPKEREECQTNGVGDILEVKIGYDGLVMAQAKKAPPIALTRKEARMALAKWVASPDGKLVANPNHTWKQINPALPDSPIEVLGPPAASGTYDAFVDLVSDMECKGAPWVAAGKTEPSPDLLRKCRTLRDDGVYVEGREHDEDQLSRLNHAPGAVAIIDYKTYIDNMAHIRAVPIDGLEPTHDSIASHSYAGSRPLYLYVKAAHLGQTPGLKEYVGEFTSEHTWGEKGYLKSLGLIPLPTEERTTYVDAVKAQGIAPSLASIADAPPAKSWERAGKSTKTASKDTAKTAPHAAEPVAKSHK